MSSPQQQRTWTDDELASIRIWDIEQLACFLGVSKGWIYKRTASNCTDPIPHLPQTEFRHLKFDSKGLPFKSWLERRGIVPLESNGKS